MKNIVKLLLCTLICFAYISCSDDKSDEKKIDIPETDISEEIIGEWVYDVPSENAWQSMKFVAAGSYFCYSDNKDNWTETLKSINRGNYGVKGMVISAANGATYLDMTISKINGYEFTGRLNETTVDFKFNKVVMRTHLTFGQSVIPPYEDLVDASITNYKSHDETIATVDSSTGEITAVANNGRTYVDIVTKNGTAVIKVMIGKVNDGDEMEVSPIKEKIVTPPQPILNLPKAILGQWIWDGSYWESINFLENGKVYYSNIDAARGLYNENASGEYTIDTSTNRLTLKVLPTGGTQMTVIMAMEEISKYSFTAKYYLTNGQSTGTFTYAKQLSSFELKSGEIVTPEYGNLLEIGTSVKHYKSHSTNIAEVNSETGEITAKKGGRTYIDIVTEDGTAVIEVKVEEKNYFLAYDYSQFIGVTREAVTEVFGIIYEDGGNTITYNYLPGSEAHMKGLVQDKNWKAITFGFDQEVQIVVSVGMQANDDAWFTNEEMTGYLSEQYFAYSKGTTETYKAFLNAENFDDASVGIAWDYEKRSLVFVKTRYQPQKSEKINDYSVYLGKSQNEILQAMGSEPMSLTDARIVYWINSKYVDDVNFEFELREGSSKVLTDVVQQVTVHLTSEAIEDIVKEFVENTNFKYVNGIANSFFNYVSNDGKIALYYNISWKTLTYSLVN